MGEAPPKSHILALAKQTIVYGIGGIALQAVGIITLPLFTRVFTLAEYGVLELGLTMSAVALALADAGLASATQRSFYDYGASQGPQRRRVVFTGFAATTAIGAVVALLLVVARHPVSQFLFGNSDRTGVVVAVALSVPLINSATFLREAMRLRFRAWHYVTSALVGSLGAAAAAIVAVVVADLGVTGFFIGLIVGNALALMYGLAVVRADLRARFNTRELRTMLRFGLPLVPAALSLWALALVDRILLGHLANLDSVGQYAVANRLAAVLVLVVTGFSLAFGPYILSIYAEDRAVEREVRAQTLRYLVIGLCTLGLVLTLFAREMLTVVAPGFDRAYEAVGFLCLGVVALGTSAVTISGISYVRRTKLLAAAALAAALVNLGLNFALIPPFGMVGAAAATAAGYGFLAALHFVLAQRLYPTPYEAPKILTTVALACLFGALSVVPLEPLALALLVKIAALVLFLLALRVVGAVDREDMLKLRDAMGRIKELKPVQA